MEDDIDDPSKFEIENEAEGPESHKQHDVFAMNNNYNMYLLRREDYETESMVRHKINNVLSSSSPWSTN